MHRKIHATFAVNKGCLYLYLSLYFFRQDHNDIKIVVLLWPNSDENHIVGLKKFKKPKTIRFAKKIQKHNWGSIKANDVAKYFWWAERQKLRASNFMKIWNDHKSYRWHGNFSWITCTIVYVDRFYDHHYITLLIRNWLVYKGDYFLYSFTKKNFWYR